MKSFIFAFLLFVLPFISFAQSASDKRTLATKIADVLAKFPAADRSQYESNVKQLDGIGEEGLREMVGMLSDAGKGDNTALEYAISAYSTSVIQPGKQTHRKKAIKVYCNSLQSVPGNVNKQFIISQLQLIGNDDALESLKPFLNDDQLSGPASRAIAQINTLVAGKLLTESLSSVKDRGSVLEALGFMRYAPAVPAIQSVYQTSGPVLKKLSLYALARIGDPASSSILLEAAKAAGYTNDTTGATSAYINYLRQLSVNGQQSKAATLSGKLLSEAKAAKQVHTRIAALNLIADLDGNKVQPLLYKAMNDDNIEFRGAALKLAERNRNGVTNKQWLRTINKSSLSAKAQIINFLALSEDKNLLSALTPLMQNNDKEVREASIKAVARIGQEDAIPSLIGVMKNGNADDIAVVKSALLRIKTNDIAGWLTKDIEQMPSSAAASVIEVLAARRAEAAGDKLFGLLEHRDTAIRNAAYRALPEVAKEQDLPRLFILLSKAEGSGLAHVQAAVTSASSSIMDTDKRTSVIINQMNTVPAGKKYLFIPTLASIGGRDALKAVEDIYENGGTNAQKTAISALSENAGALQASMLLKIAKSSANNKEAALEGYINIIKKGSFTEDQKVLMIQEAMMLASNDEQRRKILREAGNNNTFISLLFAGQYIKQAALQHDAAMAVMNIALSNPGFNGRMVRELLETAAGVIKGQDNQYQKEAIRKHLNDMPAGEGFVSMFNGSDLTGWKGLVEDPVKRAQMTPKALAAAQKLADARVKEGWEVKDGLLIFKGHGDNLATEKQYRDFEMLVDWKITAEGDAGIYLRGTPQVQIWDTSRHDVGAEVGSGGLYNNVKNPSKPLMVADNAIGEWNTFRIIMKGEKVTIYLNGKLVTDNVVLENYWNKKIPIFPKEQIELQAHGTYVAYRNLYIKELSGSEPYVLTEQETKENYKILFDGTNLDQWTGNKKDYVAEENELVIRPSEGGGGGNLFTKDEYSDFVFRFEFQMTPGANNGLGIRAPLEGDAAYEGMELQILDNDADIYKDLKPYQFHGSVYGVIPAKRGYLKPIGEWNYEEVIVKGTQIKVILNNTVILDGDIQAARDNGTLDKLNHPGLKRDKGHIGFLGHGSVLKFRNIRIKEL